MTAVANPPDFSYTEAAMAVAHFRLACYRFVLKATMEIQLPPYKGSAFRGGFGHALKARVCLTPEHVCHSCLLRAQCLYPYVFEPTLEAHNTDAESEETIPRPFVLVPPLENYQRYHAGDLLTCDLVLIGEATAYVRHFIETIVQLGGAGVGKGQGRFDVTQVQALRPQAPASEIYSGHERTFRHVQPPVTGEELVLPYQRLTPKRITLVFLTPTRLKYHQHLLTEAPAFHIIMRRLLDRLAEFSRFYLNMPLALNLPAWKIHAEQIRLVASRVSAYDWERYSNRQRTRMKLGGMVGTVTYEGDLAPFMPFLALGEWLHVGKGATFGLGKYRIMEVI